MLEAPDGLPLLPRRPAGSDEAAINRPARALRAASSRPCARRRSSAGTSTSPGTSPSPATRTSPSGCSTSATTPSPSSATRDLDDLKVQGDSPTLRDHRDRVENFDATAEDAEDDGRAGSRARYTVPCYLAPDCEPGGALRARRRTACRARTAPTRRTSTASSRRPRSMRSARSPARPSVYGHGLLGSGPRGDLERDQQHRSARRTASSSARPTRSGSRATTSRTSPPTSCPSFSNFPELTDRVQQGMLNELCSSAG